MSLIDMFFITCISFHTILYYIILYYIILYYIILYYIILYYIILYYIILCYIILYYIILYYIILYYIILYYIILYYITYILYYFYHVVLQFSKAKKIEAQAKRWFSYKKYMCKQDKQRILDLMEGVKFGFSTTTPNPATIAEIYFSANCLKEKTFWHAL